MQYQNNVKGSKRLIIIAVGVIFMIAILIGLLYFRDNNENGNGQDLLQSYTDPVTGETVTNPVGKTPENSGVNNDTATLLGFNDLLDVGFTVSQIESLILAFTDFTDKVKVVPDEVSLYSETVSFEDVSNDSLDIDVVNFDVLVARKDKRRAEVHRNSLSAVTLYIYDGDTLIYESDKIDSTTPNYL